MQPLDAVRQGLLDIVRTPYADILSKISDILSYIARSPESSRAALVGDVVCWWNLVPMDRARATTIRLPFTRHARIEAAAALEALVGQRELAPDDPFEQNLPPDQVGALVLQQLEKAKTHSELVQFEFFHLVLSGEYVPYVGHVVVVDLNPVTSAEMAEAALAHLDELSLLEAMFRNPNTYSAMSAWAAVLPGSMDGQAARLLIGYAMGRIMMLTQQASQLMMGGGGMPMMIRLGGGPGDGGPPDAGDGDIDPKKAN